MSSSDEYVAPTDRQIKDHWKAQETSVFRKPKARDPGITVVNDPRELKGLISSELAGQPVQQFKYKSSEVTLLDPVSRASSMIRAYNQGLSASKFRKLIENDQDQQLYFILYGDMKDKDRAQQLSKFREHLYREQKDVIDRNDKLRRDDDKRAERMISSMKALDKATKARTIQAAIKPPEADEPE